ncbi:hypothetical protein GCM10009801_10880 [Streptomyces albiaxialis]|uniref:Uncharacterized protein n=1 Tax=Streptomyces albiaxialis TaxID=329523 RepID=A0ABN2VLE9_9ACTN
MVISLGFDRAAVGGASSTFVRVPAPCPARDGTGRLDPFAAGAAVRSPALTDLPTTEEVPCVPCSGWSCPSP